MGISTLILLVRTIKQKRDRHASGKFSSDLLVDTRLVGRTENARDASVFSVGALCLVLHRLL